MKKTKTPSKNREIFYVFKKSQNEYSLMRLSLEDEKVVSDTVVHADVPAIVYAKLIENLRKQKVEV